MPAKEGSGLNKEFHSILREGNFDVEFYANKHISAGQKQLLRKFSKIMETNSGAQKYFSQIQQGKTAAYSVKMGVSREEYDQLIEIFAYEEPKKQMGKLTIFRDGQHLKFQGQAGLSILDSVKLKIDGKSAAFKNYDLAVVKDSIDFGEEDIPPGDSIYAYDYFAGPDGIAGLLSFEGRYELLIGKLKPSGKIYLTFFAKEPDIIENPIPRYTIIYID